MIIKRKDKSNGTNELDLSDCPSGIHSYNSMDLAKARRQNG